MRIQLACCLPALLFYSCTKKYSGLLTLQKIFVLLFSLLFTATIFSQKKSNPKIGKNETEINLFNSWDKESYYSRRKQVGCEAIYRISWKKSTKLGGGILLAADQPEYGGNSKFYGTLFADIKQFIDKRQLLSIDGRIGHGLYKEKYGFGDSTSKFSTKITAGMYYSIGPAYRIIVSKKVLITTSLFVFFRNFRGTFAEEHYSPSSANSTKEIRPYSGMGFRFGIVF